MNIDENIEICEINETDDEALQSEPIQNTGYEYRFKIYVKHKSDGTFDITSSNPFHMFTAIDFYADLSGTEEEQKCIMDKINEYIQTYNSSGITDINVYDKNNFPDLKNDWDTLFSDSEYLENKVIPDDSDEYIDTTRTRVAILFNKESDRFFKQKELGVYVAYYTDTEYSFDAIKNILQTYALTQIDIYTPENYLDYDSITTNDYSEILSDVAVYNATVSNKQKIVVCFITKDGKQDCYINM